MFEIREVIVDNQIIKYRLQKERRKTTVMNYDFKNNIIVVKTNTFVSAKQIDNFVIDSYDKLMKKLVNKIAVNSYVYNSENDQYFYYLNKQLIIKRISSKKNEVKISNDTLFIYLKSNADEVKVVQKFIKNEIFNLANKAIDEYATFLDDYHLIMPDLKVRFMTSRWGSCNYKNNIICLNGNLIHYDYDFFKAVVIHELAHLVVPNHSKRFYNVIENYEPNYKQMIKIVEGGNN